jgi:hypothetical protein
MRRICQIKHNAGVRLGSTTIINSTPGELLLEVNTAIEMQTSIRVDINIECAVISGCVDESDIAGLNKVICDDDVFLVRGDFDVVRSDCGLGHRGVIETLDVIEVTDVKGCDVVRCGECEVCEFPVLGDIGTGGE